MTDSDPGPQPSPTGRRGQLAGGIAEAVDAVVGARRSGGSGVEIATQFAGGRVLGVRLAADEVAVHIVAEQLPLHDLVERVRSAATRALGAVGDPRTVAVVVDDVDVASLPGRRQ